jgi:uncharacterized protein (TIGR03000 family)
MSILLTLEGQSMPRQKLALKAVVLLALTLWLGVASVPAQSDGRGAPNPRLPYPWTRPNYSGYEERNELWYTTPPERRAALARKYQIHITTLPEKNMIGDPNSVSMMAHLPEDALLWFDGTPTQQQGKLRKFVSPPLTPGQNYTYMIRVAWREEGRWVEQANSLVVHAGDVQCIDIIPSTAQAVLEEVKTNLAKLEPEARKLAEAQSFCVIQEGIRLGSMGIPVKVTVKGQPVFVCCEGCVAKAQNNPEQTLDQLKKVKRKRVTLSAP